MKNSIIPIAVAILALISTTPQAEARHGRKSSVYISGYKSCGTPIYSRRYVPEYDSCHAPRREYREYRPVAREYEYSSCERRYRKVKRYYDDDCYSSRRRSGYSVSFEGYYGN